MEWEVTLSGPQVVLEELSRAFHDEHFRVSKVNDAFVLSCTEFSTLEDEAAVRAAASSMAEALSGISRMLLESAAPIEITHVAEVRPDGTRNIFIQVRPGALHASARYFASTVSPADGSVDERQPSYPASVWLARARASSAAMRALRLRNRSPLSWSDLYRLYEVIVDGAGGVELVVSSGWASRAQLRRFRHSANSVAAAGDDARHGVEPTAPPTDAMTLPEARSLLDTLLARWLGSDNV